VTHSTADAAAERAAWITLASVDGLGEHLVPRLAAAFGGATQVLSAAARPDRGRVDGRIRAAAECGLRPATLEGIHAAARDPEAVHRRLRELGAWALTPWDAAYPRALRLVDPPPPVLFGVGDQVALATEPLVAVVGTRRPTPAGRAFAARVTAALAVRGVTIVSGLAMGIDGVAHATSLDLGGRTVAVIGGGLAHGWPRAHASLARAIRDGSGAIISEHPPDVMPTKGTFPRRNRIISGLSRATVVIEAPVGSGALITARHALEQGRQVFASTGRPSDPATAGCLALLRESPARPLVGVEELIIDLGLAGGSPGIVPDGAMGVGRPARAMHAGDALAVLGDVERSVATLLLHGPVSSDALISATGQPPAVVAGALTLLQLRGWVIPMGPLQVAAGPLLLPPPGDPGGRPTHLDPP